MTQTDLIRELGPQAIAGRMNRPANRMYRDGAEVSREQPRVLGLCWFLVRSVLIQKQSRAITALTDKIDLTCAAINQTAGHLGRYGYVSSAKDKIESHLLPFPGITLMTKAIAVIIWSFVE
jgi:hypothetical protein